MSDLWRLRCRRTQTPWPRLDRWRRIDILYSRDEILTFCCCFHWSYVTLTVHCSRYSSDLCLQIINVLLHKWQKESVTAVSVLLQSAPCSRNAHRFNSHFPSEPSFACSSLTFLFHLFLNYASSWVSLSCSYLLWQSHQAVIYSALFHQFPSLFRKKHCVFPCIFSKSVLIWWFWQWTFSTFLNTAAFYIVALSCVFVR